MPAKTAKKYGLGATGRPVEVDLPSGNTCLARRPGAQGLIKEGLLDDLDQLTSLVQTELIDSKDPRSMAKAVQGLQKDPKKILEAMAMIDRVIAFIVVAPRVIVPPDDAEKRRKLQAEDADAIFADEVDEEDKMFLFQWCVGGTADLAQFRQESQEAMGALAAMQGVQSQTE